MLRRTWFPHHFWTGTLLVGLLVSLLPAYLPAAAASLPSDYQHGDLVAVSGSPHLYLVSSGSVCWLADTRAAAQQAINWGRRHEVAVDQLESWRSSGVLGDPFLSFPLVRQEPPPAGMTCCPMYLAKQETEEPQPRLLWIKNLRDVELFGITTQNYGRFVVEAPQFQDQHGHDVNALVRADLEPLTTALAAVAPPPPAITETTQLNV